MVGGQLKRNAEAPDWTGAACIGMDTMIFIADSGRPTTEAKQVCRGCRLRWTCLAYAVDDPALRGVWGGTTFQERVDMRARPAADPAGGSRPARPVLGERGGRWLMELSENTKRIIQAHADWEAANQSGELIVYSEGLCYASVCTSLDDEELDLRMAARPATATRGWVRSEDSHFTGGEPNPCPCDQRPDTHRHVLFEA